MGSVGVWGAYLKPITSREYDSSCSKSFSAPGTWKPVMMNTPWSRCKTCLWLVTRTSGLRRRRAVPIPEAAAHSRFMPAKESRFSHGRDDGAHTSIPSSVNSRPNPLIIAA